MYEFLALTKYKDSHYNLKLWDKVKFFLIGYLKNNTIFEINEKGGWIFKSILYLKR